MDTGEKEMPWDSHEDMRMYESLFPLLPNYVAHYTVGGRRSPEIGLPNKNALHLLSDIKTVLIANNLGIGLTYAEKKYPTETAQSRWLGLTDRIDALFKEGSEGFRWYISFGMDAPKREGSLQDLSMQFFYRNVAAFDASKRLAELGYLCETATILRSAVEQFALCSKLWWAPNEIDIRSISRKSSFLTMKALVPSVGELYGVLSKYAHFEYEHHTHFFAYSPTRTSTLQRAPVLRAYATHLLFLTMTCIAAYVLRASPTQFPSTPNSVKKLSVFIEKIDNYSNDICSILPMDSVLANLDILLQKLRRL